MRKKRSKTIGDILLRDSGPAFKAGIKSQFWQRQTLFLHFFWDDDDEDFDGNDKIPIPKVTDINGIRKTQPINAMVIGESEEQGGGEQKALAIWFLSNISDTKTNTNSNAKRANENNPIVN